MLLFASHDTQAAKRFMKWAEETLYTVQMGTERQRLDLIDTQFGFINTKNYYNLLKKAHGGRDVMSIYILVLCKYCDTEIGKTKAIPGDNEFVVKVGKGILSQRIADHKRNYSDLLQGREPEVMLHMQVPSHIAYKIEKEFLLEIRDIDHPTSFNINGTLGTNHPEFNKYSSHGQKRKELIVVPHMYLNNDSLHTKLQCIINANVADTVCLEKHYQDIINGKDHVIQTLTSSLEVLKGALDYIRGKN